MAEMWFSLPKSEIFLPKSEIWLHWIQLYEIRGQLKAQDESDFKQKSWSPKISWVKIRPMVERWPLSWIWLVNRIQDFAHHERTENQFYSNKWFVQKNDLFKILTSGQISLNYVVLNCIFKKTLTSEIHMSSIFTVVFNLLHCLDIVIA